MLTLRKLPTRTRITPSAIRLTSRLASDAYHEPASEGTSKTPENLTPRQRQVLSQALRVDQAGELAANTIYQGQHFVLGQDRKVGDVIQVSAGYRLRIWLSSRSAAWIRKCGIKRSAILRS